VWDPGDIVACVHLNVTRAIGGGIVGADDEEGGLIGGVDVAIGQLKIRRAEALLEAELEALPASLCDVGEETRAAARAGADELDVVVEARAVDGGAPGGVRSQRAAAAQLEG
jgi:hypothetical protein